MTYRIANLFAVEQAQEAMVLEEIQELIQEVVVSGVEQVWVLVVKVPAAARAQEVLVDQDQVPVVLQGQAVRQDREVGVKVVEEQDLAQVLVV